MSDNDFRQVAVGKQLPAGGRTAVAGSEGEAVKATADWLNKAACRDSGNLFLSENPDDVAAAQLICIDCPVFNQCQDYAKRVMPIAGVWAGRDCNDHRKRGKRPIPVRSLRTHGPESDPHSCRRPECAEQSRAYGRVHEANRRRGIVVRRSA